MAKTSIKLGDKFNLLKSNVLLNGTQGLVRLMLGQKQRDEKLGLNTAGFVTGYRGSPLGAVDFQMRRASKELAASNIQFKEALNEDLAATALWGSQQAELRGEGLYDGVFGLWYGKGPGVDRSGDAMRHANMAGSSLNGGVLMAMGDDHTGESSTVLHQSDLAMIDAGMPILSPAGVQEILDYGYYGFALSRYSGLWVGLKTMKDTIEVTSVVDGDPLRMKFKVPKTKSGTDHLNIRLVDTPADQEKRLFNDKKAAAEEFARANKIDKIVLPNLKSKIGLVAAGKNWLDLIHALSLLGINENEAKALGITSYKIVQTWPIDRKSLLEWADQLDVIIVVEEKRKIVETQIKDALFSISSKTRVYGGHKNDDKLFFDHGVLDPLDIAAALGQIFKEEGCSNNSLELSMKKIRQVQSADNAPDLAERLPYFCAGCPHNSSTVVPDGSRAYAGIGCHYMAQWMDRETLGFTHMGGEGANWIGESLFSKREHVFQNIGDGTYNHSGIQAIRAAVAANTDITYKILFNDAVAMTGGQGNDGQLSAIRVVNELLAIGIKNTVLVYDDKEDLSLTSFPPAVEKVDRSKLNDIQVKLSKIKGVTAIVYVQTCAAEKRRRRKRGLFPDPDKRLFINTDICEGCGDCGVQSNCVAVTPVETELGRKREIDQSNCNKDFSCLNGFCPSFVSLEGAVVRKSEKKDFKLPTLVSPKLPTIDGTHNIVVTGVGGSGVVTIGALIAQAAQIDDLGAGMMEMAGLAQKGGAVHIHCRLSKSPDDISAIRVTMGECDALIGGDLVVSSGSKCLNLTANGRTKAVVNSDQIVTGEFTRNTDFEIPNDQLIVSMEAKLKDGLSLLNSSKLATKLMGDTIYSNIIILGASWQKGLLPLSHEAISHAIKLNGAFVEQNLRAFEIGRWAALFPNDANKIVINSVVQMDPSLSDRIDFRSNHLEAFQGKSLSKKFTDMIETFENTEIKEAVAVNYHKVLTYKDEYEIARLHLGTYKKVADKFENVKKIKFYLAPPIFSKEDKDGRAKKIEFGSYVIYLFKILAWLKWLRGTKFDIFSYFKDRQLERKLIEDYQDDLRFIKTIDFDKQKETILELLNLPSSIKGFGVVKRKNFQAASVQRKNLLIKLKASDEAVNHAAE
ncbi:MAG: indolepyruvate ferredoxin oxidoreductase family protein [Paracoccaceae bacterium]|nr:indolepyruvate ferredoxin oxidoreductase family protein [Paracoccaceae bacterium]